jgi:CPA2 family monovalent cation:H+ antiporter-2
VARGEFSIVIAGLAVTAGVEPALGPLATAYVLLLVVLGPLTARYTEPVAMWWSRRRAARAESAETAAVVRPADEEQREQAPVGD